MYTSGVAVEGASSWGIVHVCVEGSAPQASLLRLDLGCVCFAITPNI